MKKVLIDPSELLSLICLPKRDLIQRVMRWIKEGASSSGSKAEMGEPDGESDTESEPSSCPSNSPWSHKTAEEKEESRKKKKKTTEK